MCYNIDIGDKQMAHAKYLTVEDVVEAINSGKLIRRSVSQLIQYYKNKNQQDKADMFKEALNLTAKKA